ncbi:tRNA pseudouridine synthase-like 1 isoform X2 [Falco biarmicus]|uniref:tRNA pseudouridine synthase-like 1 isoform X2 n=1 Tax=Falco peregrinus TaxID=8954 RepID=UPI002478C289|nr:tRNA pseudouridine synthase-like 1 isoform X2 [Falco peregrinus]XP_056189477.1 tRNA pseudouridine synthase-like 1 isoform X2 [Falco biarmicus]
MGSPPTRYLVFFQYLGTKYSGVMGTSNDQSTVGVQNYLEKAAENLKPVVPIKFHISSRTDTGVHALCNSAHLDIQKAPGKPAFKEKQLIYSLNCHLRPEPIRILNAYQVANTFHARFCALSRTYVYRLLLGCAHHSEIPVFERDLCWAPAGGGLEFWELTFRSRAFLYRQVRRMVGALVAVGQGKLTPRHIKELLEIKDSRAFPSNAMAPPSGLFLKSVEYNEADLNATVAPGE